MGKLLMLLTLALLVPIMSCKKKDKSSSSADIEETAQQVGDNMASVDEAGGSSGAIAALDGAKRTFARLSREDLRSSGLSSLWIPEAHATTCALAGTFGSCSNNVVTRTFGGCTVLGATFTGTVALTWTDGTVDNTCQMTSSGHSIARNPNFTVTGRRGATLTVSKTGTNGQVITRGATANSLTFTNDGIRRVFTTSSGATLFDFTTQTTSGITVTGAARNGRVMNGGALRVTHNLTGVTCDYAPSNVTWTSSCNCATSGSWSANCSDGKSSTLTLTGCGTAQFSMGSDTETVTFDRCY